MSHIANSQPQIAPKQLAPLARESYFECYFGCAKPERFSTCRSIQVTHVSPARGQVSVPLTRARHAAFAPSLKPNSRASARASRTGGPVSLSTCHVEHPPFGCGSKFNRKIPEGLQGFWSMFPLAQVPFWYRFLEPQPFGPLRAKGTNADLH